MAQISFEAGEIVRCALGGPEMIVIDDPLSGLIGIGEPEVAVLWLDKLQQQRRASFPSYALRHVRNDAIQSSHRL